VATGVAGAACAAVLVAAALLAVSAGGKNHSYTVRAVFDDAGNIISGEDVKIDGVKVGAVGSVTPTVAAKAAVQLKIANTGFQNFRADASCSIRPQALIGEKYVDCLPTQPRVEGTPLPPPLHKIPSGHEGSGEYLLPVTNTHSPVDIDLLGDINRLPERQRFTIILNEFGAGLAGRGSDLSAVIRRANPALQELDRVLAILASENKVLAKLAVDSDQALQPLAAVREHVANFIEQGNKVTQAGAATRGSLARNLQLFPPFLEQLSPAMEHLQHFAEQTTPTFANLKQAASGINETFTGLPAYSRSSTKFYENLGATAKQSGPALVATKPLLGQLKRLGGSALPFTTNLSSLFTGLRDTGGLERILDFIFLGAGAANGYDALGHFLRTEGLGTACLTYAIAAEEKCSRKLFNSGSSSSATASASGSTAGARASAASLVMARTLAVVNGATPAQALAKYPGSTTSAGELAGLKQLSAAQPVGGSSGATTYYTPSGEGSQAGGLLLNYLLGNE
jgi:ABC-type transporter Mla subunit MlaD